jgi:hypothetical protein
VSVSIASVSERNFTARRLGRIFLDDLELRSAPAHSLAPVTEWDRRVVIANMNLLAAQVLLEGCDAAPKVADVVLDVVRSNIRFVIVGATPALRTGESSSLAKWYLSPIY